ncbi:hypothetical protein [Desulfobaculum bizertense]|uniref:Uncharacterized protein n=1 Tax=Desulfobaculum bizertense DSM 18034 TaxID=1121442 RepID=A0A1T4WLD2_9BACT|nr:hypothetical protein [Desulfobaculum bizertense]UIJ37069.1 hypothetical protein LWC08_10025 [Desulfobaculum bizertense]SKA78132.1 hypothetical protein SAMN02745702_02406 [Desulfobaculum bizertense DSM 18034]
MAYDIRLMKIISGEMIIGKYDAEANILKDAAVLQTVPAQQGVQMMLLPFGYPFDNEIDAEISLDHVIYEYKNCPEDLKNKYIEATSSLTLAKPGDLNGLGGGNVSDLSQLLKK